MNTKATQRTRSDKQRLYSAIVESSDDVIITKDLEGLITSWNSAAERMFGYTEEEAIGQPITMIIPPDLKEEENRILKRLAAGEQIEHYETRRVTKDGRTILVSLTISPLKDARGRIVGASKIARDITNRKLTEEAISSSVARKLIEAQEKERTWIARELHDDINQRIAMLSVSWNVSEVLPPVRPNCRARLVKHRNK